MVRNLPLGLALLAIPALAQAGSVMLPGATGGNLHVNVRSMKDKHFRSTVKQKYDFSCGSAALATLLTFHYEDPIREEEVFDEMFAAGNKEKIRKEGFSMLDMKNFLDQRGYTADGYKANLDQLAAVGVPAITLLNIKGFKHFVVVKGVTTKEVLVGDPALGATIHPRAEFETMWNGILFLIRSNKNLASDRFNQVREWRISEKAPLGTALTPSDLANITLLAPGRAGL